MSSGVLRGSLASLVPLGEPLFPWDGMGVRGEAPSFLLGVRTPGEGLGSQSGVSQSSGERGGSRIQVEQRCGGKRGSRQFWRRPSLMLHTASLRHTTIRPRWRTIVFIM